MDRDSIGSDFLGECRVPLKKLCSGIEKNFNLYLDHAMPVNFYQLFTVLNVTTSSTSFSRITAMNNLFRIVAGF